MININIENFEILKQELEYEEITLLTLLEPNQKYKWYNHETIYDPDISINNKIYCDIYHDDDIIFTEDLTTKKWKNMITRNFIIYIIDNIEKINNELVYNVYKWKINIIKIDNKYYYCGIKSWG